MARNASRKRRSWVDENDSAVVVVECGFELLDGLQVEVVRRFVQNERVDAARGEERERRPASLAGGERAGWPADVIRAERELGEKRARGTGVEP